MLRGLAALPSAPLLAPGVVAAVPPAAVPVAKAVRASVERLPAADLAVVITTGEAGIDQDVRVDLAGMGRPHIRANMRTAAAHLDDLAAATGLPLRSDPPLPVDAASLALQLGDRWRLVAVSVPGTGQATDLLAVGRALVTALVQAQASFVVVAASDGAAGLTPKAPRALIEDAAAWQQQFVDGVANTDADQLSRLGPVASQRVAARGWASTMVLAGAAQHSSAHLTLRIHEAPRGVGYVVADMR